MREPHPRHIRRRAGVLGVCAAAVTLLAAFGVGQAAAAAPTAAPTAAPAAAPTAAAAANAPAAARPAVAAAAAVPATSTTPAWTGSFSGFNTPAWASGWGTTSNTAQCAGASGTFACNWGYQDMQTVADPTAPGGGQALKVTYPADSGPPSCYLSVTGCVLGGGQFYQDLTTNGETALAQSSSLDLKYYYKFPVGFDFGGQLEGKMPGLWGGGVMGCESGAQHCAQGWSTRYMWDGGSATDPDGELYFYTASGSGYGLHLCTGNWHFAADGNWHSIEQLVNVATGSITIWSDGVDVCQETEPMPGAFSGVFFSTFHGGHDLSYSPTTTVSDEFADFTLATGGPQGSGSTTPVPATPTGLTVSAPTASSLNLSWTETQNSDPAVSYRVYEGTTLVASPTGTSAVISGLAAGSTHTYTVLAVDTAGNVSAASSAATGTTTGGGGGTGSTGLTVAITPKVYGSGFTDTVTITNPTSSAITGWQLQFELATGEKVTGSGRFTLTSSGDQYTLTSLKSDATIAADGGTLTFNFTGSDGGTYSAPTDVTITP